MILCIEIDGPQNEGVLFLGRKLRGRWDYSRVMHRDKSAGHKRLASSVQVIPGQCVELDTEKKTGRIFDALAETREGRLVFEKIKAISEQHPSEFDGNMQPHPTATHELTFDEIKDWAWHMASIVTPDNSGNTYARVLAGTIPSKEEIRRWPGKRLRDPNNTGRQEGELQKYVDDVPTNKRGRELAGAASGDDGAK